MHHIPMEYWTEEGLSYLASDVGIPLYANSATETHHKINYARVCAELDATKPLIDEFFIDVPDAHDPDIVCDEITIKVSYQWKPPVCTHCHIFGHSTDNCLHLQKGKAAPSSSPLETPKQVWVEVRKKGITASNASSASTSRAPEHD